MIRPLALAALCLAGGASVGNAQSAQTDSARVRPAPPIGVWAGLTLGPGTASNRRDVTLIGAQLAGYVSVGSWMAGYRRGGASGIDTGGAYDDALLVGWRATDLYSTGFAAIGPSRVFDESTGRSDLGIGFSAEAGVNFRAVGIGVSLFGAASPKRTYLGVGLTADAGWIR